MKEILKNEIFNCKKIEINDDVPILKHIFEIEKPFKFILYNVTEEEYQKLKNSTDYEFLIPFDSGKSIFGFSPKNGYSSSYRSSGGLKSQSDGVVKGSFVIEKDRIIYCPCAPKFREERDSFVYVYSSDSYYTTMTMSEVFKEILNYNFKFYIDTGRHKKGKTIIENGPYFIELTKEEMLLCATNPEIGKKVFEDHIEKEYFVSENENQKQYKKELLKTKKYS